LPALTVLGDADVVAKAHGSVRRSTRSKWRAGVLIAVHLVIALHIAHSYLARRTLSPVEPSESMAALEYGMVNAGAIFFAVSLLATLVFGRFFCGWGCHLVALQDLCLALLSRVGLRPKPVRSRLLAWGPAVVAVYLFAWPSVRRAWLGQPRPALTNHLLTSDLWATFPGPTFAVLTFLVCGFLAVYLLGAKGFCTYGCPYGALFGVADRLAPGRIVVSDACHGCGHCTATCTSNVRVHEEVREFGRVVSYGCMKCLDCVRVCPTGALSYGFANPLAPARPRDPARPRARKHYDYTWPEELALASIATAATLAFRGLYDGPPLLLAVCLGAITGFVALKLWHLVSTPGVSVQNLRLKSSRRLTRLGRAFALLATLWLVFTAHSGFIQWQRARGHNALERTGLTWAELTSRPRSSPPPPYDRAAAARADEAFGSADRWGLCGVVEVKLGLAWVELLRGDLGPAEHHIREAVVLRPAARGLHDDLIEFLSWQGRDAEAARALEAKVAATRPNAADHFRLATWKLMGGRVDEAISLYRAGLAIDPLSAPAHYNLGGLYRRLGDPARAVAHLATARRLTPDDPAVGLELGLALAAVGETRDALDALRGAAARDPERLAPYLPLIQDLERARGGPQTRAR
jgi:tetratricopeptide (TPR) repeat protein/Fe-S-cluster-containing hydrogenase component 2